MKSIACVVLVACGTRTTLANPSPKEESDAAEAGAVIDATEVTNAAYAAFLADPKRPTPCPGDDPTPLFDWPPPAGKLQHPVVNVDWCGATAYCAWKGKKLCTRAEFVGACGSTYPYGTDYMPHACNGRDFDAGATLPVGSLGTCEGGTAGIFDMSGNVWEWLADCDGGLCELGGGGFRNDRYNLRCDARFTAPRTYRYDYYGFRCCPL